MDDLKEHALRRAGILSMSSAWGHDDDAALLNQLLARIESLGAQLVARDAEIVAWLKCEAEEWKTTGNNPLAALVLFKTATAIEQGAYKEDGA